MSPSLQPFWRLLTGGEAGRVMILAAHPDDEVIGAASVIWSASQLEIVHVTNGSSDDVNDARPAGRSDDAQHAHIRRGELEAALAACGRQDVGCDCLDFADQNSSYCLAELTLCVEDLILERRPQALITHAYEGGHPDHDAVAFAARSALDRLATERRPALLEMTSYHMSSCGMETGRFLNGDSGWEVVLSPREVEIKRAMLNCFRSQRDTLQYFSPGNERFRVAPHYEFTQPPHEGRLFYDYFHLGVDSTQWRELARSAEVELTGANAVSFPARMHAMWR